MMKLAWLILILLPAVALGADDADPAYTSLHDEFVHVYDSLRAKGGVAVEDHPVIRSLRDRVAAYNRRNRDDREGLAMELALSVWLGDDERMGELYERMAVATGDIRFGLAWVDHYKRLDDRAAVTATYARLVDLFPDEPEIRRQWADFVKGTNRYALAIEILEQADADPADAPRVAMLLSDCLFAEQRFEEAVEALESIPAETLAADNALAREVEERLNARRPYVELWAAEQEIRSQEAAAGDLPRAEIVTSRGPIVVELFENEAPNTVANFISLAESGFYDGTTFHRVLPNFMAQGGDPNSKEGAEGMPGVGNPGYRIPDEYDREGARMHFTGSLAMANSGSPHSGGCQFYLTHEPTAHLNGKHTVFGRVVDGLDVVRSIEQDDQIVRITVIRKRDHEYEPETLPLAEQPARQPFAIDPNAGGMKLPPILQGTKQPSAPPPPP